MKEFLGCRSFRELAEKVHGPANAWHTLVTPLLEAQEAITNIIWINDCRCDEAYTSRKMHGPNTFCGELDELVEWLGKYSEALRPSVTGSHPVKEKE
jgi:hypothetical protein